MTRLSVITAVAVAASFVAANPVHVALHHRSLQVNRRWELKWKSWFVGKNSTHTDSKPTPSAAPSGDASAPGLPDAGMQANSKVPGDSAAPEAVSSDSLAGGDSDSKAPAPEQDLAETSLETSPEETDPATDADEPEPADAAIQTNPEASEAPETAEATNSDSLAGGDSDSKAPAPEQDVAETSLEASPETPEETDPATGSDEAPAPDPADSVTQTDPETPEGSEATSTDSSATDESDADAPAPEQDLAETSLETRPETPEETDSATGADEATTPEPADSAMQTGPEATEGSEAASSESPATDESDAEAPAPEKDSETGSDAPEETDPATNADEAPALAPAPEPATADAEMQTNPEVSDAPASDEATSSESQTTGNSDPKAAAPEQVLVEEPLEASSWAPEETNPATDTDKAPTHGLADAATKIEPETLAVPETPEAAGLESMAAKDNAGLSTGSTGEAPAPKLALADTPKAANITNTNNTSSAYLSEPALPKEIVKTNYAAPVSSTTNSTVPCSKSTGGAEKAENDAYLKGHNDIRAQHGALALIWATDLAATAAKRAGNCVWDNSNSTLGENLAAGAGLGAAAAVKIWTDEASKYNPADPKCSSHFTQVVWKATTEIGCAVGTCNNLSPEYPGTVNFHVCQYRESGNVDGKFAENVQV